MARGRTPKPAHLRLVDGTHRPDRHGERIDTRSNVARAASAFGRPTRPKGFKGQALAAWERYIAPATWLDASREPAAIAFCELWAEMRAAPARFHAAKHTQMRGYMADLGLTDDRRRAGPPTKPETDEFFD